MRVFGLDPGVSKAGWAIIDEEVEDFGVFSPSSKEKLFNSKINEELRKSVVFFREKLVGVDAVAWEIVPSFGRMSQRDRVVAVATALKFVTWEKRIPWVGYTPRTVKKLATGNSKASKLDMKEEVFSRYSDMPVIDKLPVDVYDAIMIATVAKEKKEWRHEFF